MTIQIYSDKIALTGAAVTTFVTIARAAVAKRGRFLVALSGGSTPNALFQQLATPEFRPQAPWSQTTVFWGDERLVPPTSPGSNYAQAYARLLQHVPIPASQIIRAKGELTPEAAAVEYAHQLQDWAEDGRVWPRFDLILLGMGSDGHTASLFPGPPAAAENDKPVLAVTATYEDRPAHRITFTPPVINDARHILFLVTGANKADALQAVLHGSAQPELWPAQRVRPTDGELLWLVDEAAAHHLT